MTESGEAQSFLAHVLGGLGKVSLVPISSPTSEVQITDPCHLGGAVSALPQATACPVGTLCRVVS